MIVETGFNIGDTAYCIHYGKIVAGIVYIINVVVTEDRKLKTLYGLRIVDKEFEGHLKLVTDYELRKK
jgi:hypothetical protein|nr:MAG TPA: hypothetical protein [Crassvirales sp.]